MFVGENKEEGAGSREEWEMIFISLWICEIKKLADARLLGVCFFGGSLLLLDILEFTDRFAIPESICFFFNSYRALCFCRFIRVFGIHTLDKLWELTKFMTTDYEL